MHIKQPGNPLEIQVNVDFCVLCGLVVDLSHEYNHRVHGEREVSHTEINLGLFVDVEFHSSITLIAVECIVPPGLNLLRFARILSITTR